MLSNQDKKEMIEMIARCAELADEKYYRGIGPMSEFVRLLRIRGQSMDFQDTEVTDLDFPQDKPERKMPEYELKNNLCVNSKWPARWLVRAGGEYCQCSFDCKVRVVHKSSGYEFVVTETELNKILAS